MAVRSARHAIAIAVVAATRIDAQAVVAPDARPSIAVMSLSGGAMGRSSDYVALGQGIAELLATSLASNPTVRVVERARLQSLLDEQHVTAAQQVDPETAVRLGRVLGANHFITGGFFIDAKDRMRIDVRSVNVETSEIEYRHTIEGTATKLFELIDRTGREVNAGLRLPSSRSQQLAGTKPAGSDDQRRATLLLGRAMTARDRADTTSALAAAREALAAYPGLTPALELVASLERRRVPERR